MDKPGLDEQASKTLFIVEDDDAVREVIAMAIKELTSFQVIVVANAVEAREVVKTLHPDLLVLDYQLPGINGLELFEKFRTDPHLKDVPVLLMSASLPRSAQDSLPMAFLEKPFRLEDFLETITHLISDEAFHGSPAPTNEEAEDHGLHGH